jgi:2-polyprenyl-6-methoxyphenol hydroxylase-like FAD-dependent oxidoreductase
MGDVNIVGGGLAACCCAQLLSSEDLSLRIEGSSRPRPACLLLSEQTQSLLRDTFQAPQLFQRAQQIRKRIVRWGNAEPVELPHSGIVVHEQELLNALWTRVGISKPASPSTDAAWTVISTRNGGAPAQFRGFGSRVATVAMVELSPQAAADRCWVESMPDGWMFLLPSGAGRAALIRCGYSPEKLMAQSRLISGLVSNLEEAAETTHHPAFPQILDELCGPHWLACGSAAMAFDPLCGEGAGHAVREALLASAVIRASTKGSSTETLLAHYETRFMHGFLKHLQLCLKFYMSGGSSDFWRAEVAALETGIAWMQERLRGQAPPRYRLTGYELQPITG